MARSRKGTMISAVLALMLSAIFGAAEARAQGAPAAASPQSAVAPAPAYDAASSSPEPTAPPPPASSQPAPVASVPPSAVPSTAPADDVAPQYGRKGQLVFGSGFRMGVTRATVSSAGQSTSQTSVELLPSFGYFISDNFQLGALVAITYATAGNVTQSTFGVGPVVAYNIPISPLVSLQPRGSIAYEHTSVEFSGSSGWTSAFLLTFGAELLIHPAPHFFFGVGPAASFSLAEESKAGSAPSVTLFGLGATIGGWF